MEKHLEWQVTAEGVVQSTRILPVEEAMLGDYFERMFTEKSDQIAIIDDGTGRQYTFGELLEISESLAAVLQKRGVKPRDLVVLCGMTTLKSCCFILALAFCQATMVATKHFYSVHELTEVLKTFPSVKLVLGDNASTSKLRQATTAEVLNLEEAWDLNRTSEFQKPPEADPKSSIVLICLTSGSTGPSKGVCRGRRPKYAHSAR